ncbi:MAG: hypothetical protein Q9M28_11565 [Mariprofundaceae bacterium]|nr:hypothetical protein [Mariprofundaceae bacterium]
MKKHYIATAMLLLPFFSGCASTGNTISSHAVPSISGTTWAGTDSEGDHYVYRFFPNGELGFTSPTGTFRDGDTWKQDGKTIYFETNKKYSEYEGVINGNTMQGKAWNTQKDTWTWTATKKK